jgi:hypothetical protein
MRKMKIASTRRMSRVVRVRPFTLWLTAAATSVAVVGCLALWGRARRDGRRVAIAELRLLRTRKRLRTAEAELQEADEYLAATGELLECYEEEFGALPVNPFAKVAAGVVDEEWQEELEEVNTSED